MVCVSPQILVLPEYLTGSHVQYVRVLLILQRYGRAPLFTVVLIVPHVPIHFDDLTESDKFASYMPQLVFYNIYRSYVVEHYDWYRCDRLLINSENYKLRIWSDSVSASIWPAKCTVGYQENNILYAHVKFFVL